MVQGVFFARLNSQTVIGGDTIDQSAVLDIQDTARGVLLPRLTTVQRNAILKPATELVSCNIKDNIIWINQGFLQQAYLINLAFLSGAGIQSGKLFHWNDNTWQKNTIGIILQLISLSQDEINKWDGTYLASVVIDRFSIIASSYENVTGIISIDSSKDISLEYIARSSNTSKT